MSTGRRPPKKRSAPTVREPHPDEYFSNSGFSWTVTLAETTTATTEAVPGQAITAFISPAHWPIRDVMICFDKGALGFVPHEESEEMKRLAEEICQAGFGGFRLTGVCRFDGKIISNDGQAVTVEVTMMLHQRRGEPELKIVPMPQVRASDILRVVSRD